MRPIVELIIPYAFINRFDFEANQFNQHFPKLSAWSQLLSRSKMISSSFDLSDQTASPYEYYLMQLFGIDVSNSLPLAPYLLLGDGGHWALGKNLSIQNSDPSPTRYWACIEPVKLLETQSEILLLAPADIQLSLDEANQLLALAIPIFNDFGLDVWAPTPLRWFVRPHSNLLNNHSNDETKRYFEIQKVFQNIKTFSLNFVNGQHCQPYLPTQADHLNDALAVNTRKSRWWMKLQNEVQINWQASFDAYTNKDILRTPFKANAFWLYGVGPELNTHAAYKNIYTSQALTRGLALAAQLTPIKLPQHFNQITINQNPILIELDCFKKTLNSNDGQTWLSALINVEKNWLQPALTALKERKIASIKITLTNQHRYQCHQFNYHHQWQFWKNKNCPLFLIDNK